MACVVCGRAAVPGLAICGPCATGEADTAGEQLEAAAPTADLAIGAYMHCGRCLTEWQAGLAGGESPASYSRLSVGWTRCGLQVWCQRHDCNVMHVDFEGRKHPANTRVASVSPTRSNT